MDVAVFLFFSGLFVIFFGGPIIEANRKTFEAFNGPLDAERHRRIWSLGGVALILLALVQAAGSCLGLEMISF